MNQRNTGRPDNGRPGPTPGGNTSPDLDSAAFQTFTVGQWLDYWIETMVRRDYAPGTYSSYRSHLRLNIAPVIGDILATELRPLDMHRMYSSMTDKGLSAGSVSVANGVVSGAYKFATRMELIDYNPVAVAAAAIPRVRQREIMPPDVDVVQKLLDAAEKQENPYFALYHVLVHTGMRRGEAFALRWANVDLDAGYLRVAESAVRQVGHSTVVRQPKTPRSNRTIDLDAHTIAVLQRHRERLAALFRKLPAVVFPHFDGGILRTTTVARDLKRLGKSVGAPGITFHQFRHFHATVALQQKQNLRVVSQRLGHANVTTTLETYSHALPGWQAEVADAFAQALRPGDEPPRNAGAGPQPSAGVAYGDGYCRGIEVAHQEMRAWRNYHHGECGCDCCLTAAALFAGWLAELKKQLNDLIMKRRRV